MLESNQNLQLNLTVWNCIAAKISKSSYRCQSPFPYQHFLFQGSHCKWACEGGGHLCQAPQRQMSKCRKQKRVLKRQRFQGTIVKYSQCCTQSEIFSKVNMFCLSSGLAQSREGCFTYLILNIQKQKLSIIHTAILLLLQLYSLPLLLYS